MTEDKKRVEETVSETTEIKQDLVQVVEEGSSGPINMLTMDSSMSLEAAVIRAEKYVEIQDRLRRLAIKVTNHQDWINQEGTPYLQWSGTAKVASAYGISYDSLKWERERVTDDKGEMVNFHCSGIVRWQGREIPEHGTGSSRDPFFGRRTKDGVQYLLPLSEIDLNNVRKKAITNFLNRGLKSLIGFSPTWEEIEDASAGKITRSNCKSVGRNKKPNAPAVDNQDIKSKREDLGKWLLELNGGDKGKASQDLKRRTVWTPKSGDNAGKELPGKSSLNDLTPGQVKMQWDIISRERKVKK